MRGKVLQTRGWCNEGAGKEKDWKATTYEYSIPNHTG